MATDADRQAFLRANRFCILATLRRDGRARLSPMGYAWDAGNGRLLITTRNSRAGAITARRDPRVTVCCFNPEQRRPYVNVSGRAEVIKDEDLFMRLAELSRGRPLTDDERAAQHRRYVDEDRVVLSITPDEFFDTLG